MPYADGLAETTVTVLAGRYDEVRSEWARGDGICVSQLGAVTWAAMVAARAVDHGEMAMKLRLIVELLEDELRPDHHALAMARSLAADLVPRHTLHFPS